MKKTFNIAASYNTRPVTQQVDVDFTLPFTWFAVADLDGDGYDELVVAGHNQSEDAARRGAIFRVDDNGHLSEASDLLPHARFPTTVWPREIIFDDFNGDKRLDVFITATGWDYQPFPGEPNRLLLSNAKGKLVNKKVPYEKGEFSHASASADIDGDGDQDIYVGNVGGQNVTPYLMLNNGKGGFKMDRGRLPDSLTRDEPDWYDTVAFADVDGDRRPDMIVGKFTQFYGTEPGYRSKIFFNNGKGQFSDADFAELPDPAPLKDNAFGYDILPFDIEGDGDTDLFMVYTDSNHRGWAVQALVNDGKGNFTDRTNKVFNKGETALLDVNHFLTFLRPRDLNNDGFMDLVPEYLGVELSPNAPAFWLNDGTGHFSAILSKEFLHKSVQYLSGRQIAMETPDGIVFALPFDLDNGDVINDAIGLKDGPVSTGPGGMDPASVDAAGFNELYYLNHAKGVAKAVAKGNYKTGLDHYLKVGAKKGIAGVADGVTIQVYKDDGPVTLVNGDIDARGSRGNDQISGRSGDNTMSGGRGHDRLEGGNGNDVLGGGNHNDSLSGGKGADDLAGGNGNDVLNGGIGPDILRGGKGRDTASYEDAAKPVVASLASPGANTREAKGDVYASIENLSGSARGDKLTGDAKANTLMGLGGNDKLFGGAGKDKIEGGLGRDLMSGGDGADIFIFRSTDEAPAAGRGRDRITDFNRAEKDKISLKQIDAKAATGRNDAFKFIGDAAFSGAEGELRFVQKGAKTYVYGDVDGNAKADFSILIDGIGAMKAADFVL
jgi:Ca2+-binding RTX toxin-like protein